MTEDSTAERRLKHAYDRYVSSFSTEHRPGSPGALRLAQARIDLSLSLAAADADLPELVVTQVARDALTLLSVTQPLPLPETEQPQDTSTAS